MVRCRREREVGVQELRAEIGRELERKREIRGIVAEIKHGTAGVVRGGESGGSGARVSSVLWQALSPSFCGGRSWILYAIHRWASPTLCSLLSAG